MGRAKRASFRWRSVANQRHAGRSALGGELTPIHHPVQGAAAQAGHFLHGGAAKNLVSHVVCSRVVVASTHKIQLPNFTEVNGSLPSKLDHLSVLLPHSEARPALHEFATAVE